MEPLNTVKSALRTVRKSLRTKNEDAKVSFGSWKNHRNEIDKFKDPRRLAIANQYPLSKEQKEQIDELYVTNYGEKVNYVWHQNFAAHSGRFDYRFFPELLFIPEFEAFQNQNKAACLLLADKNFLPVVAKGVGVKMPKTILNCTNGVLRDGDNHIVTSEMAKDLLQKANTFFIKPSVDSCSGVGCMKVKEEDSWQLNYNSMMINEHLYSRDFVIQELVENDESIKRLYPFSVNTFRVITYIWKGVVYHMPIILRIGRGGKFVDNAHAGGMFVAVDDNGVICNHAVTEFTDKFDSHPDTNIKFCGYQINNFQNVWKTAIRMHEAVPQIGVVNWDITLNHDGAPVLIEANTQNGSVWLPQMAHGTAPFAERTEEVLQWLRFMKKLKPHERGMFVGGYMG